MNSDHFCIRPVHERDRAGVLALAPRLTEGVAPWRDQQGAGRAARQWLTDSLAAAARDNGTVLVAVGAAGVTGVVTVSEQRHFTGETDGYIGELAVAAHAVRRGAGRALVASAETWARERGLCHLTLHTGMANITARRFYACLRFLEEEIRLTRPVGSR
jgi:GNAT superfamily N-acetyltransferase